MMPGTPKIAATSLQQANSELTIPVVSDAG